MTASTIQKSSQKDVKQEVQWGPIGREVYESRYARTKADGTIESWEETVKRVVDGNLGLVPKQFHEPDEREKLIKFITRMDMLPAGRHLWASGVPGKQFLFNCHAAGWSREDLTAHFNFTFDELMKGGGVGSNYSNRYIDIYPPVFSRIDLHIVCDRSHPNYPEFEDLISKKYDTHTPNRVVVEDSREGWCLAFNKVIQTAWLGKDGPVILDMSMLREKGATLKGFGGKSAGPGPLSLLLRHTADILNSKLNQKLSSLDMMMIDHEVAICVLSGGVRRSSRMSIKHWKDPDIFDFIHCKFDPKFHWTTNISIEVDDEFFRCLRGNQKHARKVFRELARNAHKNGEPGVWNSSLSSTGEIDQPFTTNPCGEVPLSPWDVCCLSHVNLEHFAGKDEDAKDAFRLLTRFLVRATFGDVLNPLQKEVIQKNRRIGVGFFGFHAWLVYQGVKFSESHHKRDIRDKLKNFRHICRDEARKYAFTLRIPEPIKVTTIAPTGTISNLPGTTSGCQPVFAKYFKRLVIYSYNDPNLAKFVDKGYKVEDSLYSPNAKVVTFYCKDPLVAECEKRGLDLGLIEDQSEISISDHLAVQAMLQDEYADNGISYTINFDPKEIGVKEIETALRIHLPHLKGTTLMPEGDSRPQSPLQKITKEDFEKENQTGRAMVSDTERDCASGSCPIK